MAAPAPTLARRPADHPGRDADRDRAPIPALPAPPGRMPDRATANRPRPDRPRWLRPASLLAALGIAAWLAFGLGPVFGVVLLFVVIVPFEKLFPRHRQRVRRPHLGTDIAYALVATPLTTVGLVVGIVISAVSLAWIPGLLLRPLVLAIPTLPRLLLGIVLFDLVLYWAHRFAHEVPFLWRFHKIHHSTEHLDWISGFRAHPFDGVLLAPPFALLLVAGFDPDAAGALVVIQVVFALFLHANVRWRLRPLQKLVATPEFHHWHHTNQPEAIHANYAALLPVNDLLFGTYYVPRDRRPSVYGVDDAITPGIIGQLWDPFRGLRKPWRFVRHPVAGARDLSRMLRGGLGQLVSSARRSPGPGTVTVGRVPTGAPEQTS
jgi:sterol desaturase/sphingolipid hydroxylase (fatty acid hydroxylase superfamily)